jgi:hypothetical protein
MRTGPASFMSEEELFERLASFELRVVTDVDQPVVARDVLVQRLRRALHSAETESRLHVLLEIRLGFFSEGGLDFRPLVCQARPVRTLDRLEASRAPARRR